MSHPNSSISRKSSNFSVSRDHHISDDEIKISSNAPGNIRWDELNKFTERESKEAKKRSLEDFSSIFFKQFSKKKSQHIDLPQKVKVSSNLGEDTKKENKAKSIKSITLTVKSQTDLNLGKKSVDGPLNDHQVYLLGDRSQGIKDPCVKKKSILDQGWLHGMLRLLVDNNMRFNILLRYCPTIHPEGRFKLFWNIFFCTCILYQFFTITIELFFDADWDKIDPELQKTNKLVAECLKYFIVTDVVLNMLTGYYHHGDVILEKRKIFKNYLKKLLIIDALVVVPLFFEFEDNIQNHKSALYDSNLSIIKLLFIFRLVKLNRTFYYIDQILSINERIEGVLALVKLGFKILFTAHLFACIWFFIGDFSKHAGYSSWLNDGFQDCKNCDWRTYYLRSIYWSITTMITIGYGDITPKSNYEVGFVISAMIFGCGMFAYSISKIGIIFEKIFADEDQMKSKLRVINRFMKRKKVSFELQGKVRRYLNYFIKEASQESSKEELELINKLSASLRRDLLLEANGKIVTNSSILKNNFSEKTIRKLTEIMIPIDFAPDEFVYQEGENSTDVLYFVIQGKIDQFINVHSSAMDSRFKLKTFKEGDVFGSFSFFTGIPREMTTISVGYSKLYTINRRDFLSCLKDEPIDYEKFCLIRDRLVIYKDRSDFRSPCLCCHKMDHIILRCPLLTYNPDRKEIIDRYISRKKTKRRVFYRKNKKSLHPWITMLDLKKAKDNIEENYFEYQEHKDNSESIKSHSQDEKSENSPRENRINSGDLRAKTEEKRITFLENGKLKSMKSDHCDFELEREFPESGELHSDKSKILERKWEAEDFSKKISGLMINNEKFHSQSSLQNNNASLKKDYQKLPSITSPKIYLSPKNKQIVEAKKNEHNAWVPVNFKLFDGSFDEGKNFSLYFPHNNRKKVVEELKKNELQKFESNVLRRMDRRFGRRLTITTLNRSLKTPNQSSVN